MTRQARRALRVLPSWLLFDRAGTRRAESRMLASTPPHLLMARAGESAARLAMALAPDARSIDIACGPGNNGGDGLVAARWLHQAGRQVRVRCLGATRAVPTDAAWALQSAIDAGVPIVSEPADSGLGPGLFIDALLGIGASRGLEGHFARWSAWASRSHGARVLAIDCPSGLDVDTGQPWDGSRPGGCVQATQTLALLTLKPGYFTARGRDLCGEVWFDPLVEDERSLPHDDAVAELFTQGTQAPLSVRRHASHKGTFGDVVVIGGASGMSGAASLAADAALSAGAGRVYVSLLDPDPGLPLRPELMRRERWWLEEPTVLGAATVVCGCGGGDRIAPVLPPLLARVPRLVLDADALNAVAADPALLRRVQRRHAQTARTVVTPHPLEAARLLGCKSGEVQADRLLAARELADRLQCCVVLKGSGTIIAVPGGRPGINASGNAALATPGTGDVLAGWLGGCWSAWPDRDRLDPGADAVARWAVFTHGHTADLWAAEKAAQGPLLAANLIGNLRASALCQPESP